MLRRVKKTVAVFAALSLSLLACSSSKGTAGSGASTADAGPAAFPSGPTTWTMTETVPASSEVFLCQYVSMPATAGWVVGGQNDFTVGSHHLVLYKTDLTAIPPGQNGVAECYEGTDGGATPDFMDHIRGVVYPSATPVQTVPYPAGVGLPYVANEVYLFQVHYLNATGSDIDAVVNLHLTTATSGVTTNSGVLFFYNPFIDVPANATAKAAMRCPIPQNITVFGSGSHLHARGVGVQAYLDTATAPATSPFYTSTNWASPTVDTASFNVTAGSYIRYYCDYDNTQGTAEYIQGPSAEVNEMCMFIGMYYPALTSDVENCINGDEYGTGTNTCMQTLTTLTACPEESSGPEGTNYTECVQKAFVNSCPNVSAPLVSFLNCSQASCTTQCGTGGDDAGTSSACTQCITQNCASQYLACENLTGCN